MEAINKWRENTKIQVRETHSLLLAAARKLGDLGKEMETCLPGTRPWDMVAEERKCFLSGE